MEPRETTIFRKGGVHGALLLFLLLPAVGCKPDLTRDLSAITGGGEESGGSEALSALSGRSPSGGETSTGSAPQAPQILSTPPDVAIIGETFVYEAEANGTEPIVWRLEEAPPGMSVGSTSGRVTWLPDDVFEGETVHPVLIAENDVGSDSQTMAIQVGKPPAFDTEPEDVALSVGRPGSFQLCLSQGTPPITWETIVAPEGMTVTGDEGRCARVEWTPPQVGTNAVSLRASNLFGSTRVDLDVRVGEGPAITSTPPEDAIPAGALFLYVATATGDPELTWRLERAPEGMTLSPETGATTTLSWKSVEGVEQLVETDLVVENAFGSDRQTFTIDVAIPPRITSADRVPACLAPFSYQATATGSTPIRWSLEDPPDETMTIDETTGRLDWTPSAAGNFTVTVVAVNRVGRDDLSLLIEVNGENVPRFTAPGPDTHPAVGEEFRYTVPVTGCPPILCSLEEAPPAMTIEPSTCTIVWTPGEEDLGREHPVTVKATNDFGSAELRFTLTVASPPRITSAPVTGACAEQPYSYPAEAEGSPPITWSLRTGPPGMTISAEQGTVTWQPVVEDVGSHPVAIEAANEFGTDTQEFSLAVRLAPTITSTPPAEPIVAEDRFTYQGVADGSPPLTWSLVEGPSGAVVNPSTGLVTWQTTADDAGTFDFVLRVENACGTDEQAFTVTVQPIGNEIRITSVSPSMGLTSGGLPIVLSGRNFKAGPGLSVTIDNIEASDVTFVSDTEIRATTPPHFGKIGLFDVGVRYSDGTGAVLEEGFRYFYEWCDIEISGQSISIDSGSEAAIVESADLDGNGDPDLVVSDQAKRLLWSVVNRGDGGFTAPVSVAVTTNGSETPLHMAIADFDGDLFPDVAVARPLDDAVSLLFGRGDGRFDPFETLSVGGTGNDDPVDLAAADLDGNGSIDLAVVNSASETVSILLNDGTGTFEEIPQLPLSRGSVPRRIAAGDLDGNGTIDLLVTLGGSDALAIGLGNGDGTFRSGGTVSVGDFPNGVALADFNKDGNLDAVVANEGTSRQDDSLTILLGSGDGTFGTVFDVPAGGNEPHNVVVGDRDGDTNPDIVVSFPEENAFFTFYNLAGDGTFGTIFRNIILLSPVFGVTLGDYDGDDDLDLATTYRDDRFTVWFVTDQGGFCN